MNNTKPEEIYKAICSQTVELIFTAHPTQVKTGISQFSERSSFPVLRGNRSITRTVYKHCPCA